MTAMTAPWGGPADLHTDPLYRVLRAAVNFGVLAVAPGTPPRFEHTEGSRLLMDSHPATIWPMARPVHPVHQLRYSCSTQRAITFAYADISRSGVIPHTNLARGQGRDYTM